MRPQKCKLQNIKHISMTNDKANDKVNKRNIV